VRNMIQFVSNIWRRMRGEEDMEPQEAKITAISEMMLQLCNSNKGSEYFQNLHQLTRWGSIRQRGGANYVYHAENIQNDMFIWNGAFMGWGLNADNTDIYPVFAGLFGDIQLLVRDIVEKNAPTFLKDIYNLNP
jgi:hypothetical protein